MLPMYLRAALCTLLLAASVAGKPYPFRSRRSPGEIIQNYDVVRPRILHKDNSLPHPKLLEVEVDTGASIFTLKLELNMNLLSPQFSSRHHDQNGKEVIVKGRENCFYHGAVLEHPEWTVTVSTCKGLRASFGLHGDKNQYYHLEPLDHDNKSLETEHAMYADYEVGPDNGVCGSEHSTPHILGGVDSNITTTESARNRRQSGQFYYVELVIVSDHSQYVRNDKSVEKTVQRAIEIANLVDNLYRMLNIRIILVDVITWSEKDELTSSTNDPEILLDKFQDYYLQITSPHDISILLTGKDLMDNIVGIAYTSSMCDDRNSIGLVQDGGRRDTRVSATMAHEMGHTMNMGHDDKQSCGCSDGTGKCIMTAVTTSTPIQWSQCSIEELDKGFDALKLDRCLHDVPSATVGGQVCGDGVCEGDEECDCGNESECKDNCCDAETCKLVAGAECSPFNGECCTGTCQLKVYGTTCRAESGDCDIAEYCSGSTAECPADAHIRDGTPCMDDQAYCYSGECRTVAQQCEQHFGPTSLAGYKECFFHNVRGDVYGNCGYNTENFTSCSAIHSQCGLLYCVGGTFQTPLSVQASVVSVRIYSYAYDKIDYCQAFTTYPGNDFKNPGLVKDGTKCGDGKMCHEQQCKAVSQVNSQQTCPSGTNGEVCSGKGKCSNKGKCVCEVEFLGDNCETKRPVNECANNNGGCEHICTDTDSSFQCSCRVGYQLASDGTGCNNMDECSYDNGGCSQTCTDTQGSFLCGCHDGYTLSGDGKTCTNIDECSHDNGDCSQTCTDTQGSFLCGCHDGYTLSGDGKTCTNIDECSHDNGGCSQTCTDTQGSFLCGCHDGYTLSGDGTTCTNINECDSLNGGCMHTCEDTEGTYKCRCNSGFNLADDQKTCNDINECSLSKGGCQHTCTNTEGSFQCSCQSGFLLAADERSCIPLGLSATCGVLTAATGSIKSEGWPKKYNTNTNCDWIISLPDNQKRVNITFDSLAFGLAGRLPECKRDYVEIFDGADSSAPSFGKFCGCCDIPVPFSTSSSVVKVIFHAGPKHGTRRVGFHIKYQSV